MTKLMFIAGTVNKGRRCHVVGATAARVCGVAARAAMAPTDGVIDPSRRSVYSGLVLFDLTITFRVERSLGQTQ
jgi:hypothetical protein